MVVLPDLLAPNLQVVFCGTAAGSASARAGAYYGGPGNGFWKTLHEVGLTPKVLEPAQFPRLLEFEIGLTDVSKVAYGSDLEVGKARFDLPALEAAIEAFRPRNLAFNGKNAAQAVLGSKVGYGRQRGTIGGAAIWVLPSTSGAARGFWDISYWQAMADAVGPHRNS